MFSIKILGLLLLTLQSYSGHTHNCIHHELVAEMGPPTILDDDDIVPPLTFGISPDFPREFSGNERKLTEFPVRPLRILPDYTFIQNETDEFKAYIGVTIFPRLLEIIQTFLSVNDTPTIGPLTTSGCSSIKWPASYKTTSTDTDLLIFFRAVDSEDNFMATAMTCLRRASNKRPIIGIVKLNKKYIKYTQSRTKSFMHVLLHEITHILGHAGEHYKHFQTPTPAVVSTTTTTNAGTLTTFKLVTPKLVALAKEHFGCDDIDGIPLENEGSSGSVGSHFEKSHFGNEVMTAQMTGMPIFSKFTLTLLEESGWYIVTHGKSEKFHWGKNRGCSFYNNSQCSSTAPEFCTVSGRWSCSSDYLAKNNCTITPFSDKCRVNEYFSNSLCESSLTTFTKTPAIPGNRCFEYTYKSSRYVGCMNAICNNNKISIKIGGVTYPCSEPTNTVPSRALYKSYSIRCPDPADFCTQFEGRCQNDCSFNGRCLDDNTCRCFSFYKGDDCSQQQKCRIAEASYCATVNPNGEIEAVSENENEDVEENTFSDDNSTNGQNVIATTNQIISDIDADFSSAKDDADASDN